MSDIVKVVTMKPIMRRMGMPAIAKIGSAQKGCSMLATYSCFAGGMSTWV